MQELCLDVRGLCQSKSLHSPPWIPVSVATCSLGGLQAAALVLCRLSTVRGSNARCTRLHCLINGYATVCSVPHSLGGHVHGQQHFDCIECWVKRSSWVWTMHLLCCGCRRDGSQIQGGWREDWMYGAGTSLEALPCKQWAYHLSNLTLVPSSLIHSHRPTLLQRK